MFISHDNRVEYGILIILEVVLLQERQTLSRCDDNVTAGCSNCPDKIFKKVDLPAPFAPIKP